jgi:hypothetical protein
MAKWSSTPEGWLLKSIITIYYRRGHRQDRTPIKASLRDCLQRHVSRKDMYEILGVDVTDHAIQDRGHKGTYNGPREEPERYIPEHPDVHPVGKKVWPCAVVIVAEGREVPLDDIYKITDQAMKSRFRVKAVTRASC